MIDLIKEKQNALEQLCAKYGVKRLELFGSASTADVLPEPSDIDFLVDFNPGVNLGPWLSVYFDFRQSLELLFGCSVDLVMVSALQDPYFIQEVNRSRRLLYAA